MHIVVLMNSMHRQLRAPLLGCPARASAHQARLRLAPANQVMITYSLGQSAAARDRLGESRQRGYSRLTLLTRPSGDFGVGRQGYT
eukprot:3765804-Pleurochrysis_carterae.AAC.3